MTASIFLVCTHTARIPFVDTLLPDPFEGGYWHLQQVTEYNVTSGEFTDRGEFTLTAMIWGTSSFYTQIGSVLYVIHPSGNTLCAYNMATNVFVPSWPGIAIPTDVGSGGCLTSDVQFLYVLGGRVDTLSLDTIQILDKLAVQWINVTAKMQTKRRMLSCVMDAASSSIYAIAGYDGSVIGYLSSIEKIDTDSLTSQTIGSLTELAGYTRSILHKSYIYVVGGYFYDRGIAHDRDTMHVIDTDTDSVHLLSERLPYGVYAAAAAVTADSLFVFGGSHNGHPISDWMIYALLSTSGHMFMSSKRWSL